MSGINYNRDIYYDEYAGAEHYAGGVSVSAISPGLARAADILEDLRGGIYKAVGSAIKRAAEHGKTVGMKIAAEEYTIGQNELKKRTKNINTIINNQDSSYSVTFGYKGHVIPLIKFDTKAGKDGYVSTRVLRSNTRTYLNKAFIASGGQSYKRVYERAGKERYPLRQLYGPSAVQAFTAHEENVDKMEAALVETYEKRIDHEITRVLNGGG